MIVRIATLDDVARIREIAEITWPVTYSSIISPEQIDFMLNWMYDTTTISTAIQVANEDFLVLLQNDEIIGFSGIEHNYGNQAVTHIHKLYVLPDKQGLGCGKLMLRSIETEAKKRDVSLLHLNVNKQNPAVQFYFKYGFKIDKEVVLDIGNGFVMDDYELVLAI
jgi:ribosomal protein S18 acetylase RimI-like enzyme